MVVFSYASLLPAGLFGYLWWAGAGTVGSTITFVELVCLYGYSLTIYIPVSLLWLVPVCFILIHPCLIVLLDRSPGGSGSVSSWALASPGLSSSPRSGRRSGTRPPSPPWSSWPSSSPSTSCISVGSSEVAMQQSFSYFPSSHASREPVIPCNILFLLGDGVEVLCSS